MVKVYCFMAARNEAENLEFAIKSLEQQTLPPCRILVIDDGSIDNTGSLAAVLGCNVCILPHHKESYLKDPAQSWKLSKVFNIAFEFLDDDCDFLLQMSPDIWLPRNYVADIISHMDKDPKLVVASGEVNREPVMETHVRGAGRIYRADFWRKHLGRYNEGFSWESYPLFKAQSLGFSVKSFPEISMISSRASSQKSSYGYCMSELGYFPIFAVGRCLKHILLGDSKTGVGMLSTYLKGSPYRIDDNVRNFVRRQQLKRLLTFWRGK